MNDVRVLKETKNYRLVVSPNVEGIGQEPHYAVQHKEFGVVEFRSPNLGHAFMVMEDAEEFFVSRFQEEEKSSILTPEDIDVEFKNGKFKH